MEITFEVMPNAFRQSVEPHIEEKSGIEWLFGMQLTRGSGDKFTLRGSIAAMAGKDLGALQLANDDMVKLAIDLFRERTDVDISGANVSELEVGCLFDSRWRAAGYDDLFDSAGTLEPSDDISASVFSSKEVEVRVSDVLRDLVSAGALSPDNVEKHITSFTLRCKRRMADKLMAGPLSNVTLGQLADEATFIHVIRRYQELLFMYLGVKPILRKWVGKASGGLAVMGLIACRLAEDDPQKYARILLEVLNQVGIPEGRLHQIRKTEKELERDATLLQLRKDIVDACERSLPSAARVAVDNFPHSSVFDVLPPDEIPAEFVGDDESGPVYRPASVDRLIRSLSRI
ncbi:MAG: hypothetical protein JSS75_04100 [Bacteroidetes bacterium]|nr:hypothetical protein [Bacteroidota bacterium]